ncbi:MAG: DUF4038 domain-containing protein [Phycisphaerae bacterium]
MKHRGRPTPVPAPSRASAEPLEPRMLLATYSTTVDLPFTAATTGLSGTGFSAVLPSTRGGGYVPANVALSSGQLRLTSTAGDLTNNSQANALNVPINGAADFQIETRLTSFAFTKNYQYAGLLLATGEDNYLNLITGYVGGPVVELAGEANKVFSIPAYKTISPAGIRTLDLRLTGTAATKQVTAEYRINSDVATAWVAVGTVAAAQVFSTGARAGVVSTNVGSATPVVTTFDRFTARHTPSVVAPPPPPPPTGYSTVRNLSFNAPTTGLKASGFSAVLPTPKDDGYLGANVSLTTTGQLRITSTVGDLPTNTQRNALVVPIYGTGNFQLETRLTSFGFTKNYQYAGLVVGTTDDNYLTLLTGYINGPVVQIATEAGGKFAAPASRAINPAGIQTIDLRLTGNAATKQVTAEYRINSDLAAGWISIGTVAAAHVFSTSARAGVLTSHSGSTTPVTTTFDSFAARHNPVYLPPPPAPPAAASLPLLKVSDNRRYLATADTNSPFFWTGDTAWRLFYDTGSAGADQYLADRAAKGFNVVYATAFNMGFDSLSEYGHGTFANSNINTPNDSFFKYVDYVVAKAASLGLYVAFLPAWGDSVSYADARLFDTTSAFNYTKWLATRYQNQTNIVWVLGGDAPGDDGTGQAAAIWRAMAAGLQAGDGGKHLVSFHPNGSPASSSTWFQNDGWLDFHMVESGHSPNSANAQNLITADYNRASPIVRPVIDFENNYENLFASLNPSNPPMTDYDVRKKNYWAVFAGAFGATYGNWEIYEFNTELDARFPYKKTWQQALNYPGAQQMKFLRRLMQSRPFVTGVPDQSILTTSALSGADHIRATRASDGAYAMIYTASGKGFSVNMAKVAGPTVDAHWYNPRTGQATYVGRYANTGSRAFTPPSPGTDWVLVLDQTTRAFKTPGAA